MDNLEDIVNRVAGAVTWQQTRQLMNKKPATKALGDLVDTPEKLGSLVARMVLELGMDPKDPAVMQCIRRGLGLANREEGKYKPQMGADKAASVERSARHSPRYKTLKEADAAQYGAVLKTIAEIARGDSVYIEDGGLDTDNLLADMSGDFSWTAPETLDQVTRMLADSRFVQYADIIKNEFNFDLVKELRDWQNELKSELKVASASVEDDLSDLIHRQAFRGFVSDEHMSKIAGLLEKDPKYIAFVKDMIASDQNWDDFFYDNIAAVVGDLGYDGLGRIPRMVEEGAISQSTLDEMRKILGRTASRENDPACDDLSDIIGCDLPKTDEPACDGPACDDLEDLVKCDTPRAASTRIAASNGFVVVGHNNYTYFPGDIDERRRKTWVVLVGPVSSPVEADVFDSEAEAKKAAKGFRNSIILQVDQYMLPEVQ